MECVGSFEAKTNLARLLGRVSRGERFIITRHGRPAAMLVPVNGQSRTDVDQVIDELLDFRHGLDRGCNGITREQVP
jgi:prevent-host-death family protein